jgi:Na+/H+-dicarboxylate symporter
MGELFLRALKMVVIPLIFFTIVSGIANNGNAANLGKIGIKTLGFYIFTMLLALVTGLVLVNVVKPGEGSGLLLQGISGEEIPAHEGKSVRDLLISIIPDNFFSALTTANTLQIIVFAILLGFSVTRIPERQKEVLTLFFEASAQVMMKITLFILRFAPYGIFGIVARQISLQDNPIAMARSLGGYMGVVIAGLCIHSLISLPAILMVFGIHPVRHYRAMLPVMITAFSTSSSNATLPLTLSSVQNSCGVSQRIAGFTLPLGATINMNGTALYEIVAAIFIAQVYGIHLPPDKQVIGVLVAMLAAVGAAGVPMAGLVTMTLVFTAMGLPVEGIALVLTVDRPLDMFRTLVNVLGDTCGAVVVAKTEGEKLLVAFSDSGRGNQAKAS